MTKISPCIHKYVTEFRENVSKSGSLAMSFQFFPDFRLNECFIPYFCINNFETMKARILLIILSVISLMVLNNCAKDNNNYTVGDGDYMIFGHFYGMCAGEQCIEIFKIDSLSLYEDNLDIYPSSEHPYDGNYVKLSGMAFDHVKYLRDKFPAQLLQEANHVIGMPDAGDWGGLYVEIKVNGVRKYWLIDKMRTNLPAYLIPFVNEMESCIAFLQ